MIHGLDDFQLIWLNSLVSQLFHCASSGGCHVFLSAAFIAAAFIMSLELEGANVVYYTARVNKNDVTIMTKELRSEI